MKEFSHQESEILADIIRNRRDVRGNLYTDEPISEEDLHDIIDAAIHAPSVGYSQPWEFVIIRNQLTKKQIHESFLSENKKGAQQFEGDRQELYRKFRLEGVLETPVNMAVFHKPCDEPTLGATSMEEMRVYSVVCAVQNMWLMARSLNIGMGWLSILDPDMVKKVLNAPEDRTLVAYLCVGHVKEFLDTPELETAGWDTRRREDEVVIRESY